MFRRYIQKFVLHDMPSTFNPDVNAWQNDPEYKSLMNIYIGRQALAIAGVQWAIEQLLAKAKEDPLGEESEAYKLAQYLNRDE
jgi:hypothetical protein